MDDTKKWRFLVPEGLAGQKAVTLKEHTAFWPEAHQEWLYGYATAEDGAKGTLWGKKIDFYLEVQPFEAPIDLLAQPHKPEHKPRSSRHLRNPEKQAYIERVEAKLAALRATFPPPPDRALEERGIAFFGNDRLILPMAEAFQIWMDESLEPADKCRKAASILGGMKELFANAKLPEELLRHDTKLCEGLCKLLGVAQTVAETAKQQQIDIGPGLAEMILSLDRLTDEMVEGGKRLWNLPREMTPEEYDAYIDKTIEAEFSDRPLQERLKLMEELWEDPLVGPEEKVEYMEMAIQAVRKEGRKKPSIPCPHKEAIQQHLNALAKRLDRLEREGEEAWQRRAAQELYPTCQAWREDSEPELPPLSLEEFAAGLQITSLIVKTSPDEAGEAHFRLELAFTDEHDSFADHWITANVEDDALISVDLEG